MSDSEKTNTKALDRRAWMLRLGELVALAGISGAVELDADGSGGLEALNRALPPLFGAASSQLPPGLYRPSTEHLGHALASGGRYHAAPPGSETDYVAPPAGAYRPVHFTPDEFAVVHRIVQLLLGAPDADRTVDEVTQWIDFAVAHAAQTRAAAGALPAAYRQIAVAYYGSEQPVKELENENSPQVCHEGLAWLAERSNSQLDGRARDRMLDISGGTTTAFLQLAPEQQLHLLESISDMPPKSAEATGPAAGNGTAAATPPPNPDQDAQPGKTLFKYLKAETIRGFYTSEAGLKELDYKGNYFYAESPGCAEQK
jgi:hypothetical protein